ncbi:unnamed protein product [Parascedosporium putredinis]|uniref:Protamine P1 n=1 Tax=Parascedosporium putredinis TaxID=1442378 RepID=A0A9P1MBK4_9PEZI|nr:unnamed protein product [Parascedosporium putredinis]CAI7999744.1 unnamed protein product [Parascedosporium putredinis]
MSLPYAAQGDPWFEPLYCRAPYSHYEVLVKATVQSSATNEHAVSRYEHIAQRFLSGKPPFILTAGLKGPFDPVSGWQNPWDSSVFESSQVCTSTQQPTPQRISDTQAATVWPSPASPLSKAQAPACTYLPSPESLQADTHPYLEKDELTRVERWRNLVRSDIPVKDEFWASKGYAAKKRVADDVSWLRRRSEDKRARLSYACSDSLATADKAHETPEDCYSDTSVTTGASDEGDVVPQPVSLTQPNGQAKARLDSSQTRGTERDCHAQETPEHTGGGQSSAPEDSSREVEVKALSAQARSSSPQGGPATLHIHPAPQPASSGLEVDNSAATISTEDVQKTDGTPSATQRLQSELEVHSDLITKPTSTTLREDGESLAVTPECVKVETNMEAHAPSSNIFKALANPSDPVVPLTDATTPFSTAVELGTDIVPADKSIAQTDASSVRPLEDVHPEEAAPQVEIPIPNDGTRTSTQTSTRSRTRKRRRRTRQSTPEKRIVPEEQSPWVPEIAEPIIVHQPSIEVIASGAGPQPACASQTAVVPIEEQQPWMSSPLLSSRPDNALIQPIAISSEQQDLVEERPPVAQREDQASGDLSPQAAVIPLYEASKADTTDVQTPAPELASVPTPLEASSTTFSIRSFSSFMTPSAKPRFATVPDSNGRLLQTPSTLQAALENPWQTNSRPKKRVSWAPLPDEPDFESQETDPTSSRSQFSRASPPPSDPIPDDGEATGAAFKNHFVSVKRRTKPLRQCLLPPASQRLQWSPKTDAMAQAFVAAETVPQPDFKGGSELGEDKENLEQEPLDDVDAVLENLGDFLNAWDVDTDLEKSRASLGSATAVGAASGNGLFDMELGGW